MRELLTRSRRRCFGYLILATLLMKMVAPALSHALVAQPASQDRWLVAICTATGLKYIAVNTVTLDVSGSEGERSLHPSSADHCLLCNSTSHDGITSGSCWDASAISAARTAGATEETPTFQQKLRWSPAHPRAPPLA